MRVGVPLGYWLLSGKQENDLETKVSLYYPVWLVYHREKVGKYIPDGLDLFRSSTLRFLKANRKRWRWLLVPLMAVRSSSTIKSKVPMWGG